MVNFKKKIITDMRLPIIMVTVMAFAISASAGPKPVTHRVMTCNIRVTGLPSDEKDGIRWDDRKATTIQCITKYKPDIIMMQEVIYDSYAYCREKLKNYFAFGFEGPEMDPYTEGYHLIAKNVIFFSKARYEYVSSGTYWLSETPLIAGSMSWETNRARHLNWVRVRDRKTGKEMRLLDTHLDHKSTLAKTNQARMIVEEAAQYPDTFPQILCGDFNSRKWNEWVKYIMANGWTDVYDLMHNGVEFGYTAHNFYGDNRPNPKKKKMGRIDYILTRGPLEAVECEVLKDCPNGIWPSDHYFMLAVLKDR